jgi:hypothetical protein
MRKFTQFFSRSVARVRIGRPRLLDHNYGGILRCDDGNLLKPFASTRCISRGIVLGHFRQQPQAQVFGVTYNSAKMRTLHYGAVVAKQPRSAEDAATCRLLGQRLAEWTAVCVHWRKEEHPSAKLARRMPPG